MRDGARPEPVTVAEITASAFRLTRVPPLLGRPLLESDERPGALPVVVLGYTVWQTRFARPPGRDWTNGATRTNADHRGGRHAGRLRVPDQSPDVGAAAAPAVGLRAARRRGHQGVRPAGAWIDAGAGQHGAGRTRRTDRGGVADDTRAPAPPRAGVRRRVTRRPVVVRVLHDAPADPAGADGRVRERRDLDLRANRDARRGDCRALRARRRARTDRRPVVRRSAGPRVDARRSSASPPRTSR